MSSSMKSGFSRKRGFSMPSRRSRSPSRTGIRRARPVPDQSRKNQSWRVMAPRRAWAYGCAATGGDQVEPHLLEPQLEVDFIGASSLPRRNRPLCLTACIECCISASVHAVIRTPVVRGATRCHAQHLTAPVRKVDGARHFCQAGCPVDHLMYPSSASERKFLVLAAFTQLPREAGARPVRSRSLSMCRFP